MYTKENVKELSDLLGRTIEKTIVEGDLWYIENFLSEPELEWFKPFLDDPKDWYTTMRSPYKNILNKFLGAHVEYNENGDVIVPTSDTPYEILPIFANSDIGIWPRLHKVLPPTYHQHTGIQTFKYVPVEEIPELTREDLKQKGEPLDYAMDWHCERPDRDNLAGSFSLYLNDDYEGGELEFKHKPYKFKLPAGTLINIPVGEEWTHRINVVLKKDRHTLYGNCWLDDNVPESTPEDC